MIRDDSLSLGSEDDRWIATKNRKRTNTISGKLKSTLKPTEPNAPTTVTVMSSTPETRTRRSWKAITSLGANNFWFP